MLVRYSCGPFSRVFFLNTQNRGLRTFARRVGRTEQGNSQLQASNATFAGGKGFAATLVDTACLTASSHAVMPA